MIKSLFLSEYSSTSSYKVEFFYNKQIELGLLDLVYQISGNIENIELENMDHSYSFADELWKKTCFELFLSAGENYFEFNFSSSTRYALYEFSSYRVLKAKHENLNFNLNINRASTNKLELLLQIRLDSLPQDLLGLIEENKIKSFLPSLILKKNDLLVPEYWAAKHSKQKPDFHDASVYIAF